RICPGCKQAFAFEPREGDPVTDVLFKNAIAAVSAQGQVRFGVEHLYYEVCRRKRRKVLPWGVAIFLIACSLGSLVVWSADRKQGWGLFVGLFAGVIGLISLGRRSLARYAALTPKKFRSLYARWCDVHGQPEGVIQRREQPAPPPQAEPDL